MKAKSTVFLKQIAGQNILVDLDHSCVNFNKMITINSTGVFIWECLQSDKSMQELTNEVATHFGTTTDQIQDDITEFVSKIKQMGLIND